MNYATENENRCCQESRYRNKILLFKRSCCIFVHSHSERFNFNWTGDRIASAFVLRRRLYVDSTCSVLSSNLSTARVLFSGTAIPASTANFSDTCSFSPKFNESVTCFAISCSGHVFAERLCAITNATITLQGQFMPTGRNQPSSLSTADQISADSSALLKRVSVPKFFGQKKNYEA